MAVVAHGMALGASINHALAPTGGVASTLQNILVIAKKIVDGNPYVRSPSQLFSNPTDLCAAVGASDPITAPFLQ